MLISLSLFHIGIVMKFIIILLLYSLVYSNCPPFLSMIPPISQSLAYSTGYVSSTLFTTHQLTLVSRIGLWWCWCGR